MTVKRNVLVVGGLLLLGAGLSLASAVFITPPWVDLGWRRPVASWLESIGLGQFTGIWAVLWLRLPEWTLFVLAGAAVGAASRTRWLLRAGAVVTGVLLATWAVHLYLGMLWHFPAGVALHMAAFDALDALLIITAAWAATRLRSRRFPPGHCQSCGYSLRGLTGDTCPECGAPVASSSAQAVETDTTAAHPSPRRLRAP